MGDIKPNQNVKLFLDSINTVLDCKVRRHENDRIILDYDNSVFEYIDYLQEGDEVGVKIFTPIGVIVFDAMILYSPLEDDFIIEYVESSPKIQRREYARVNCEIKITLEKGNKKVIPAKTMDISGGGMRFQVEESENASFAPDENVLLTIFMPKSSCIVTEAIIISNPNLPKNVYVLQYTKIEESDREKLIQKIYEIQRKDSSKPNFEAKVIIERKSGTEISAKTLDISGVGLKIEADNENINFSKNEEVKITLYMPECLPIKTKAKIIDVANLPENVHVLQFINIDEAERERIIQITEKIEAGAR